MVSFHLLQDFKTAMPAPLTPTRHHLRVHAGCERAAPARNPHRVHATGGARMPGEPGLGVTAQPRFSYSTRGLRYS